MHVLGVLFVRVIIACRVLKQQRIQELTEALLQIDENISMLCDILVTISTMTCNALRSMAAPAPLLLCSVLLAETRNFNSSVHHRHFFHRLPCCSL